MKESIVSLLIMVIMARIHSFLFAACSPIKPSEQSDSYLLKFRTPNGARCRIWCGVNKISFYPMPDAIFLKISGAKLELFIR